MDQTTQMKTLLEAVDGTPKVDEPSSTYANTPNEQTLDSHTQQNFGRDLNKKKPFQQIRKQGDNARASKMATVELEEQRLTRVFAKFKLDEQSAYPAAHQDSQWSSKKELYRLVDKAVHHAGDDLHYSVTKENIMTAITLLLDGNVESAVDELMQHFSDHNGGERRDHDIYAEELQEELEDILEQQIDETLETAGDSSGESETLKALHHKGVDRIDGVKAKVFGPTEAYPAPWKAVHVGGRDMIYAVKAANYAEVASWLGQVDAEKIVDEVS